MASNLKASKRRFAAATDDDSDSTHRRSQGGQRGYAPQFFKNIVILCFERRFSKQNNVIHLKSNIFAPRSKFWSPLNIWAGYATDSTLSIPDLLAEAVSSLSENTNPFLILLDLFRNLTSKPPSSSSGSFSTNSTGVLNFPSLVTTHLNNLVRQPAQYPTNAGSDKE